MKINKPLGMPIVHPYQQAQKPNPPKQSSSAKDQLQISPEAKQLLHNKAQNKLTDSSRQEKVNKLKEQVQAGTYQVDSAKVAEKWLEYWKGNKE